MKRVSTILLSLIAFSVIFLSCKDENDKSYSELQELEDTTIKSFIKRNNIEVVTALPSDNEWGTNKYYLSSTGLYIHIDNIGDSKIAKIASKSKISLRYNEYYLDENKTLILRNWEPIDFPNPTIFTYLNTSSNTSIGVGIHEAVGYMKNYGSVAKIIVPSTLNTSTYSNSLTPVGFDLKITNIQ